MATIEQTRRRAIKVLVLLWVFASVLAWVSMGQASAAVSDRAVDALAGEIVRGLNAADLGDVPAGSGYSRPTIAIKAFTDDGGPVDVADANYVNDRLLMALQRQAGGRFRFVARDAVGDLIADIDATTEPSAERDARLRDLQANLRADILIRGTIRRTARGPVLTYQAVASESGALFVSTTPLVMAAHLCIGGRYPPRRPPSAKQSQRHLRSRRCRSGERFLHRRVFGAGGAADRRRPRPHRRDEHGGP